MMNEENRLVYKRSYNLGGLQSKINEILIGHSFHYFI